MGATINNKSTTTDDRLRMGQPKLQGIVTCLKRISKLFSVHIRTC